MANTEWNLQMYAEEAGGASAAAEPAAAPAESTAAVNELAEVVNAGDTLGDGTTVPSARVAAALQKQMARHPNLKQVYKNGAAPAGQPQAAPTQAEAGPEGPSIEERWEEAKKGEFAEMYGRDVQNAIKDRFKNQADANEKLNAMEPMLKVLRERAGVATNEDLVKHVMDDDSLYEEAANEAGMTIPAYKQFMQMKAERDAAQAKEQQDQKRVMIENHFRDLVQQGEELKKRFPNFNLQEELKNPNFFRMTQPGVGLRVEDAYFAVHHKELAPQMMAYGMQRAKTQMGQTLQAQQKRPQEGAMRQQGQAADVMKLDPSKMTRQERERIKQEIRLRKRRVSFD